MDVRLGVELCLTVKMFGLDLGLGFEAHGLAARDLGLVLKTYRYFVRL